MQISKSRNDIVPQRVQKIIPSPFPTDSPFTTLSLPPYPILGSIIKKLHQPKQPDITKQNKRPAMHRYPIHNSQQKVYTVFGAGSGKLFEYNQLRRDAWIIALVVGNTML